MRYKIKGANWIMILDAAIKAAYRHGGIATSTEKDLGENLAANHSGFVRAGREVSVY